MKAKNILIIDDDDRNIFALSAVLKSRGYICLTCQSVHDALEELQKSPVDVILTDMMMPDMDGYEFIRKIKNDPGKKHIPVFAVTAQAMPGDQEKSMAAGADAYISKPIDVDRLLGLLTTYLA